MQQLTHGSFGAHDAPQSGSHAHRTGLMDSLMEVWSCVYITLIRRTLASRRSCFTAFWAMTKLLLAALLFDMTESD